MDGYFEQWVKQLADWTTELTVDPSYIYVRTIFPVVMAYSLATGIPHHFNEGEVT